tara:strand:- start:7944 stop:8150 length:207 start_codon:yes stop_codon:yes gene_type:complete
MIKTKFATKEVEDWIVMMVEFEDKLTKWSGENANTTWDMEVFVGEDEYFVIVTVDSDEKDNNTDRLEL